jgi:hypothetical protein
MNLTQQPIGTQNLPANLAGSNTAATQSSNSKQTSLASTKGSGSQSGRGLTRKKPKQKSCKVCRAKFSQSKPMQAVCSPACAMSLVATKKAKAAIRAMTAERKETRAKLEKLKTRAEWAREAQSAFNRWVRLRDADKPCISCQRHHGGQYHAGHYLSRGARPELAYEPLNCHKQCSPCNLHLSGNVALYRKNLVDLIGQSQVEWLEGPHEPKHFSVDDLKAIKAKYTALARELEKARA